MLKAGAILICTKGYTHPNMGRMFMKGHKYQVKTQVNENLRKDTYIIGNVNTGNGGIYCGLEFIKEHFDEVNK